MPRKERLAGAGRGSGPAAAAIIERENSNVHAIVLPEGTPVTRDFRCDRVWVWIDRNGSVVSPPRTGGSLWQRIVVRDWRADRGGDSVAVNGGGGKNMKASCNYTVIVHVTAFVMSILQLEGGLVTKDLKSSSLGGKSVAVNGGGGKNMKAV
ncbi:hypothetical protein Nepgr_029815 [Nepenthes gracilis]|uniref:Uncharacterized protein n=1 Tax=Nepenthes gracilis TaxID=150966 RepID=A0AAD3Y3C2_NEPGR|nr:hypothetical protein Nepgr_029815 [Nepenthes gracilis]